MSERERDRESLQGYVCVCVSHFVSPWQTETLCVMNWFTARFGPVRLSGICIWPWTLLLHVSWGINLFGQGIKAYWLSRRWNGQTWGRYVWYAAGPVSKEMAADNTLKLWARHCHRENYSWKDKAHTYTPPYVQLLPSLQLTLFCTSATGQMLKIIVAIASKQKPQISPPITSRLHGRRKMSHYDLVMVIIYQGVVPI